GGSGSPTWSPTRSSPSSITPSARPSTRSTAPVSAPGRRCAPRTRPRVALLRPAAGTFRTLVIDFPWEQEHLSESARATCGYACMTEAELFALPVAQWAAEECHLYFWTPNNFMARACAAVERYGFQHRTIITWKKSRWGHGSYFRNITEHVIFATKDDLRT